MHGAIQPIECILFASILLLFLLSLQCDSAFTAENGIVHVPAIIKIQLPNGFHLGILFVYCYFNSFSCVCFPHHFHCKQINNNLVKIVLSIRNNSIA